MGGGRICLFLKPFLIVFAIPDTPFEKPKLVLGGLASVKAGSAGSDFSDVSKKETNWRF